MRYLLMALICVLLLEGCDGGGTTVSPLTMSANRGNDRGGGRGGR
jgi:hypothetical protein